jgi:hypothetical protein
VCVFVCVRVHARARVREKAGGLGDSEANAEGVQSTGKYLSTEKHQ